MFHEEWDRNALCAGFIEDNPDVVEEIRNAKAREMAKAMLAKEIPLATISEISGLSEDEIKAL